MYVLSYQGPNFTEVRVVSVENQADARKVIDHLPEGACGVKFGQADDLKSLSAAVVVKLYNSLAETPVVKFDSAAVGRERLFSTVSRIATPAEVPQGEPDEGSLQPNAETDEPSEEPEASASGETEEDPTMAAKKKSTKKTKTPKPKAAPRAKKPKAEGAGRAAKFPDTSIITAVQENPKRKGTGAYERYNKYKVGKTLGEAKTAGVTQADIWWDTKQGFVKVKKG